MESFDTPILLLTWRRPAQTRELINALRVIKPEAVYIVSDGARNGKIEERQKVEETRSLLLREIDWDCCVETMFRAENLGCKTSVSQGISWFFNSVAEGIILEDDCIPSERFFWFAREMLREYRNCESIASIGGYNEYLDKSAQNKVIYSRYFECWGWATWRRAWEIYQDDLGCLIDEQGELDLCRAFKTKRERWLWRNIAENLLRYDKPSSWAYRFLLCSSARGMVHVIPNYCLVKNIGFGKDSTHHKGERSFHQHSDGTESIPSLTDLGCWAKIDGVELEWRDRWIAKKHGATIMNILRGWIRLRYNNAFTRYSQFFSSNERVN